MALSDRSLNNFATALCERVARRAAGEDEDSVRLVGIRPSDHVLTGFLTPARTAGGSFLSESESALAEDLPQDSAYEQTALGFEWLAPRAALEAGGRLHVAVSLFVYVRRFPTLSEQRRHAIWRTGDSLRASGSDGSESAPHTFLVPVWTREGPTRPLEVEFDLRALLERRALRVDCETLLASALDLGSGLATLRGMRVSEDALRDEDAYQHWITTVAGDPPRLRWRPIVDVRLAVVPTEPGVARVALRVLNGTPAPSRAVAELLDPNLYAVQVRASIPPAAHTPMVFRELTQSYRYDRRMPGLGINSHVVLERLPNELILRSEAIPKAQLGRLEPRRLPNAAPRFDSLARDPIPTLRAIHAAMEEYDRTAWEAKVASLVGFEREEAERDRRAFRGEIEEFAAGIALLEDARYPLVLRAFKLMNEVMGEVAATSRSPYSEWRLFQVVFIVSQLRILASREYPELSSPDSDRVDLLWFAAGGGKTEAFLGLIIWHAFFDRLRGKRVGVTALVRFPLRLLTFQQLQRLGRALGVAEKIRKREGIAPGRISLGYFVGGTLTDNRIRKETHERYVNQGLTDRHKQVFQCPFCQGPTTVRYEASLRLIEHHCARQAACPGGAERLPVYVVDDDLYCYLPTVIVSTVDKLAALGQNQRFANLLGRFDMVCPLHGASFLDSNGERCDAARERQSGDRPERCGKRGPRVLYGPFHDPGPALLIQDELHLLSEELGTFDAHYETAVAEMCRSFGMRPWKVIGATATIKDFGHHAYELYLKRGPRQFPSPGPEADESFYYVLNPQRIGRIFLGLLGVARKHTPAVTRALSIIYLELEAARALAQRDPDAACAAYDTDRMTAEEWRRLLFLYELPVTYALTRKGSDQVAEAIESRVKKELLDLAPGYGNVVMQMFNGGVDVAEMIEVMEAIREAQPDGDPATRIRGLVTTNIIGHGVDIARFNIMVFAGFPRLVAEYIQASARVGRTYPGISIFLPTPQSERDRGVFNRFAKFHEYLDRLVDPAAITRWPLPALERTVPGILAGYLMGVASAQVGCLLPTVERVKRALGQPGAEALTTEAMTAWMRRAYGAELAPSAERYRVRLEATAKRRYFSIINAPETTGRPKPVNTHLGAMRSLRDVDEPADICVERDVDRRILRSLIRGRP